MPEDQEAKIARLEKELASAREEVMIAARNATRHGRAAQAAEEKLAAILALLK
jgi:hypothetical protein